MAQQQFAGGPANLDPTIDQELSAVREGAQRVMRPGRPSSQSDHHPQGPYPHGPELAMQVRAYPSWVHHTEIDTCLGRRHAPLFSLTLPAPFRYTLLTKNEEEFPYVDMWSR